MKRRSTPKDYEVLIGDKYGLNDFKHELAGQVVTVRAKTVRKAKAKVHKMIGRQLLPKGSVVSEIQKVKPATRIGTEQALTKKCYTCQKLLYREDFHQNRASYDGLQSTCRVCKKAYDDKRSGRENLTMVKPARVINGSKNNNVNFICGILDEVAEDSNKKNAGMIFYVQSLIKKLK